MHSLAGRLKYLYPFDHTLAFRETAQRIFKGIHSLRQVIQSTPSKTPGSGRYFRIQCAANDPTFILKYGAQGAGCGIGELENDAVNENRGSQFG